MYSLEIIGGLIGLIVGGELLVRGSVAVANRLNVPPLIIGLTLVGFGTSSPELVTSLTAALAGSPGIAVGNVVGSNIANILLILGLTAAIAPVVVQSHAFWRDGSVLLASTLAVSGLMAVGEIGRLVGMAFVTLLVAYIVTTYVLERRRKTAAAEVYTAEAEQVPTPAVSLPRALTLAFAGLLLTVFAARFLVSGAVTLATSLGISETVIGLTIVAVGTSMPELVTSIVAGRRGHSDVAFGNIIGSNIFNLLGILGVTAAVHPLVVPESILALDVWVMLATTVVLCVFIISGWRLSRQEGLTMLGGYTAYTGYLISQA